VEEWAITGHQRPWGDLPTVALSGSFASSLNCLLRERGVSKDGAQHTSPRAGTRGPGEVQLRGRRPRDFGDPWEEKPDGWLQAAH